MENLGLEFIQRLSISVGLADLFVTHKDGKKSLSSPIRLAILPRLYIQDYLLGLCNLSEIKAKEVEMNHFSVGANLFMKSAILSNVQMQNSKISDQLRIWETKISGILNLSDSSIGNNVYIKDNSTIRKLLLTGTKIEGTIQLANVTIDEEIIINSASIKGSFRIANIQADKINMESTTIA